MGTHGGEDNSRPKDGPTEVWILLCFHVREFSAKEPDGLLDFSKIEPYALALGTYI